MLKGRLIHPQILEALGRAGHGSKVLIADGNYPFSSKRGPNAQLVNLNLSPGIVTCTQVLEAIVSAVPVEAALVMKYAKVGPYAVKHDPPIWAEYRRLLAAGGSRIGLRAIERFAFYRAGADGDVVLTVATGEQAIYANLLLTLGVLRT